MPDRLHRIFFAHPTVDVARDLVGCVLVRTLDGVVLSGRIVETEAYGDETDLASHAAVYRRSRIDIMQAQPGTIYVYRSYGVHSCFNIVAHEPGAAGAVLIRAAEPISGHDVMAERRGVANDGPIASGPGRLGQAFALEQADTGRDVVTDPDILVLPRHDASKIVASERIGITRDTHRQWRFYDPESPALSRPHRVSGR
ncbi:MAG TPA: DNA-3-methyladenine glycosylase [Thermomicrobiales bacterium]|nr:DNA-3-methyladenine glycosylase [Thermomicrobiales bacterium]